MGRYSFIMDTFIEKMRGLFLLNHWNNFAGCSTWDCCVSPAEGAAWGNCVDGTGFSGGLRRHY